MFFCEKWLGLVGLYTRNTSCIIYRRVLRKHLALKTTTTTNKTKNKQTNKPTKTKTNKKDRWDSGKPHRQQVLFFDSQINICILYRSATTQNLSDLDFDPPRSLKVKFDTGIGLPISSFLLLINRNIGPN